MRFADLDAVTVDAYGTLVVLRDPVPALTEALRRFGVDRSADDVRRAVTAEVGYYAGHKHKARDGDELARLRHDCAAVFLEATEAEVDVDAFAPAFLEALVFEPLPGAVETVRGLVARGLAVAVAANWDIGLREHLRRLTLDSLFATVVTSAEAGPPKPDPCVLETALDRLGVDPARALHVGDNAVDEQAARAAGVRFEWAPLADSFAGWR